jgi:hypothetical protein
MFDSVEDLSAKLAAELQTSAERLSWTTAIWTQGARVVIKSCAGAALDPSATGGIFWPLRKTAGNISAPRL